jgi:hypothetical protein
MIISMKKGKLSCSFHLQISRVLDFNKAQIYKVWPKIEEKVSAFIILNAYSLKTYFMTILIQSILYCRCWYFCSKYFVKLYKVWFWPNPENEWIVNEESTYIQLLNIWKRNALVPCTGAWTIDAWPVALRLGYV